MYTEKGVSKKLRTFAEKNEWLISGEYIYGEEAGYLFTGLDTGNTKSFITPVPGIDEDQTNELYASLDKNASVMMLKEYEITDGFLCIRINDSMSLKSDNLEFIIALLVGVLQDITVVTVNRCQECGELGANNEDFMYDLYCYMHPECAEKFKAASSGSSIETLSDDDKDGIGYVLENGEGAESDSTSTVHEFVDDTPVKRKVLYTIGGALLGSIPWLILPFVLELSNSVLDKFNSTPFYSNLVKSIFTCICAYLVSYFAIVGYKLSRARVDNKGRWIVGIVSIAAIILIQFAYLAIMIAKEPSVVLTFTNYLNNLIAYGFYVEFLSGIAIGIVFTLIAVLPFFDSTVKTKKAAK